MKDLGSMRLRSLLGLLLASFLVGGFGAGVTPALAQYDSGRVYIEGAPPPPSGRRYQRRIAPYSRAYQAPPSSGFYFPWFRPEPAYAPQPSYRPERRRARPEPPREVRRRAPQASPSREADKKEEPQVEPSTFVVVFGDSLADLVGKGLDDAFEENLDVEIVNKTKGDSGLVRTDNYDWPKAIQDVLASDQKISFAVMMVGANDRQAIREGDLTHDPLSDRWRELYRDRVDAAIRPFVERRIPFVWIGVPPMKNDKLSADFIAMNDIYKDRVQRAGGVYVDIWQAFANEDNKYSPVGPDVEGQMVRLRTNDGVQFTRAGARKAAHFADVELKRLIEARAQNAAVAALPANPTDAAGAASPVDRMVNAAVPAVPDPSALPALAPRPVAGPVLPLTRVDVSPGGALASEPPRPHPDTAYVVQRTLREGVPPPPKAGRADDFTWPPKE
jgi:hypothetical protein